MRHVNGPSNKYVFDTGEAEAAAQQRELDAKPMKTHFISDLKYPSKVTTLCAYQCVRCGRYHRNKDIPTGVLPWSIAVMEGLKSIDLADYKEDSCKNPLK
jgi:hypothetical protein